MRMKFEDYTKDQQKAIISKGKNIIVSAGAGSGKTQVLTERVIHFIKNEHYHLNEFLILTFTELAAGEMKNRIRKALKKANLEDAALVDTADICTFDAYAFSLVKKYHFMLNVASNVSIVDSNIINVRKKTIIDAIFEDEYEKEDHVFLSMVERFCFKDDKDLKDLLFKFYNKSLLQVDSNKYIEEFITKYYDASFIRTMKEKFDFKVKKMHEEMKEEFELLPNAPMSKKDNTPYFQAAKNSLSDFFNMQSFEELHTYFFNTSITLPKLPNGLSEDEKVFKKKFTEKLKKFQEYVLSLPKDEEEFMTYFFDCRPYTQKLIELLKELDAQIRDYKREYQVFEFDDIAKMALSLVRDNKEVQENIKNSLKMIMVDEYQDTSGLQEEFISYIGNNNVYMVGDVKQSIYRFRNAKSDIFTNKYNEYKKGNGGMAIDLNANFRSRKEVLDDINFIFKQIMTDNFGGANYAKDHVIEYGNKAYLKAGDKGDSSHSDFLVYEKTDSFNTPIKEANLVAQDILFKIKSHYKVMDIKDNTPYLRDCRYSDFCILMDRGTQFDKYLKVFNDYKIPLYAENDENISQNIFVLVLTNILRLIKAIQENDYTSKSFIKAFLSVARSFVLEYKDDELLRICKEKSFYDDPFITKLREIVIKNSNLSIEGLFEKVIFELDLYQKSITIGNVERNEKYLDMFLEQFTAMSKLDYSIDDFISFLESVNEYGMRIVLSSNGTSLDSVRIMNIHKSKGLEFNIVYFTGLASPFNRMDMDENFSVSAKYGMIYPPLSTSKTNLVKELNKDYEIDEDTSEKIRLFYVSLTRTREKMIFVTPLKDIQEYEEKCNYEKYKEILNEYHLKSLAQKTSLDIILDLYKKESINLSIFKKLLFAIDYTLPKMYFDMTFEDQKLFDASNMQKLFDRSEHYQKFALQLIEKYKDKKIATQEAFLLLKDKKINLYDFKQIIRNLKVELDLEFYFAYQNEPLSELLDCWIKDAKEEVIIPKESQYSLYLDRAIEINETKSYDDLKLLLELTNIKLREEVEIMLQNHQNVPPYMRSSAAISNPNFEFDREESLKMYLTKVVTLVSLNKIMPATIDYLTYVAMGEKPFLEELKVAIKQVFTKQISISTFTNFLTHLPLRVSDGFIKDLQTNLDEMKYDDYIFYLSQTDFSFYTLKEEAFQLLLFKNKFMGENIVRSFFSNFKENKLTLDEFIELISCMNYELSKEFTLLSIEEKQKCSIDSIDDVVISKGEQIQDLNKMKTFYEFLYPFIPFHKFDKYVGENELICEQDDNNDSVLTTPFEFKSLNLEKETIITQRASRQLDLSSSHQNMDFGTKIHFALEVLDFLNPNFDMIDDKYIRSCLRRFLNSDLMTNVKEGNIFKEYEFIDEDENVQGIIDLLVIYADHIDVIDYKTKNIDEEAYDKQLLLYGKFVQKIFNKPVNMYLYSLMNGDYRKVANNKKVIIQ